MAKMGKAASGIPPGDLLIGNAANTDDTDKNEVGRPSKFTPEILETARAYFDTYEPWFESPVEKQLKDGSVETRMERLPNPPPSILDLSRHIRNLHPEVSRRSIYDWAKVGGDHEKHEFSQLIKREIEELYPEVLQENAILGRYAQPFAIFAAKNRMKWHDKQEIDHTHHVEPMVIQGETGKTLVTLGAQVVADNKAP